MSWLRSYGWIVLIVLVGIAVRLYAFGSLPPGLNQDEAATGYDAWSVLRYGIDRNDVHLPMMFISWGSGMYALSGYLAWPFMLVGGLNAVTMRLPHLLLGILALYAMYILAQRSFGKTFALLALFFLATNPWHIMISRWGLDSNVFPELFLFGVLALAVSLERPRFLWLATVLFALCPYTYGTAYVVVPLFVLLAGIALRVLWNVPWKMLLMNAALFFVIVLPVVLYVLINQFGWNSIELPFMTIPQLTGVARFHEVSTVFGGSMQDILHNLGTLWHLLLFQDDGLIWNRIMPYGMYYPIGLPFALVGIFAAVSTVWESRGKHIALFVLIWIAAAVILGALESVNINRINIIFPPLVYCMTYGVYVISQNRPVILWGSIGVFTLFFLAFTTTYFRTYENEAGGSFFYGLQDAIEDSLHISDGRICVTDHANMPYITALVAQRTNPHIFANTVSYDNPGSQFQHVLAFGRFTFGIQRCVGGAYDAFVLAQDERGFFPPSQFTIHDYHNFALAIPQ